MKTRAIQHQSKCLLNQRRNGTLLIEMVVCTILLSTVAAILVPGIHAIRIQRKFTRFETLALIELNNVAAQATTVEDPTAVELSRSFTSRYSDAKLTIEASEEDDASLKRLHLTIRLPNGDSKPDLLRTLSVWIATTEAPAEKESVE